MKNGLNTIRNYKVDTIYQKVGCAYIKEYKGEMNMKLKEKEGIIIDMINMMYESEIGKSIFIYSQVDEDYKFIGKVKDVSVEIDTLRQHPMVNVSYHLDDETCIILEKLNDSLYRFDFYYNEDLDIDENDKESGFNYEEFYKMKEFGYKYNIIEDLVDTASFFIKEEYCIIK